MLKALAAAIDSAERQRPTIGEPGLWFGLTVGGWYVQVSFDGFADLSPIDDLERLLFETEGRNYADWRGNPRDAKRRNGRVPKHLMARVAKLLPGLPPPEPVYDDEPF